MTRARDIANAAHRRLWLAGVVRAAGRCATLFAAGGLALVVADRALALHLPVWALVASPLALGVGASIALGARARRRAGDASVVVDHALGLRDRVSSAIALEQDDADSFAILAQREGERASETVDLRRAIPLRFDNWWVGAPIATGALLAGAILLPTWDALGRDAQRVEEVARRAEIDDAVRSIDDSAQRAREALAQAAVDAATPEQLAALDEIEQELAQGRIRPDEARAQAASRLDDLARSFEDRAERDDRAADALAERFGALDADTRESNTRDLEEALKRADFDAARRALEQLQRDLASQDSADPDAARERLARDLDAISRALQDAARQRELDAPRSPDAPPTPPDAPRNPDAFDALREQGLPSERANELADERDPRALRDSLEREGLTPEQADRLARQIAEENRRLDAQEQAERDAQDLADALQDLSRDVRDNAVPTPPPAPPTPPQPPSATDPSQPQDAERDPSRPTTPDPQGREDRQQPGQRESDKDPGAQQRNPQQGPSRDVGTDQGDEQQRSTERGRRADDAQKPDAQNPQPGPQDAPTQSKDDAASPSNQPAPPDSQPTQRDPGAQGTPQETETTGSDAPGADQDAQREQESVARDDSAREGDRSAQGEGVGRAMDKLREMQRRQQDAQQSRETAQRLREQAEQLLEQASPEEREQARRLAELLAQEQGPTRPFDTARFDDVDARQAPRDESDDAGRVIAEWLSQGRNERDGTVGRADAQRRITDAARGAQRAIEEQQTPPRYADMISRYFRRLPDAARQASDSAPSTSPRAPAPTAPDAAPKP